MQRPEVRILIAELNPRMRDFLRREFSRRNFIVEGAGSGDELFATLDSGPQVHVVVLAANTPDSSGKGLLQKMVSNYSNIPVILHTYLDDLPDDPALEKVAAMVEKRGNPEDLTRMVTNVLERYYPDLAKSVEAERSDD